MASIPSDHRWYTGLAIADVVAQTIESLNLRYPEGTEEDQHARVQAQVLLEDE